jgi:DNA-binding winged helix-turn-helix (wHTH) protein
MILLLSNTVSGPEYDAGMRTGTTKMMFSFEDFVLDSAGRELCCGKEAIAVEPQVFDLLEYLIRHRDRVASKDDLLATVWKGRLVSDATIASRISAARAALRDNGENQRLIRTVPRKGVRFVGKVSENAKPVAAIDDPNLQGT